MVPIIFRGCFDNFAISIAVSKPLFFVSRPRKAKYLLPAFEKG